MNFHRIAIALVIAVSTATAQISTGPGICFSFNTAPVAATYLPLVAGGEIYFGFTAAATSSIDRIDFQVSSSGMTPVTAQVFHAIGITLGAHIATTVSVPTSSTQITLVFSPPIAFTAGSTYALHLTSPTAALMIVGNSAVPTPIQYLLNCGASPPFILPSCQSYPISGMHGTILTFRSTTCGQSPYASAMPVGVGCGGTPPILSTTTPPVLGSPFTFSVSGFFQTGTCHIFWAAGPATVGVSLGSGCRNYLDPISLQAFAAAGFEPFVSMPIMGVFNATSINLPPTAGLAGVQFTAQAALYLSTNTGIPTPYGNFSMTNALELTLGY